MNEVEHLGALVKNMTDLHQREYKIRYNLHENLFFRKLVSPQVLDKLRAKPLDYFKSLIFLDYYTRILSDNDFSACDNIETLSKAVRDIEREKGIANAENGASYFKLETVVLETGMCFKQKHAQAGLSKIPKNEITGARRRYQQDKISLTRKIEPFYEGLGEMVKCQISEPMQRYIPGIKSRADLGALIFSDSVIAVIKNKKCTQEVVAMLECKDYLGASITALDYLASESSPERIKQSILQNNDKR